MSHDPSSPRWQAEPLVQEGNDHLDAGRLGSARRAYRRALALLEPWGRDADPTDPAQALRAAAWLGLGDVYRSREQPDAAVAAHRRALAAQRPLARALPNDVEVLAQLADIHADLAYLFGDLGKPASAARHFRRARTLFRRLTELEPGNPDHRHDLADAWYNLGRLLDQAGRGAKAEACFREAEAGWRALCRDHPEETDFPQFLSDVLLDRAALAGDQGRPLPELAAEAVGLLEPFTEPEPVPNEITGRLYHAFATWRQACMDRQDGPALLACLAREVATTEALAKARPDDADRARAHADARSRQVAWQADLATSLAEVQAVLAPALAAWEEFDRLEPGPEAPFQQAELYNCLGIFCRNQGLIDGAEEATRRALRLLDGLVVEHPEACRAAQLLAKCCNQLGVLYQETGRPALAEPVLERSLDLHAGLLPEHADDAGLHVFHGGAQCNLGHALADLGRLDEARAWYQKAVETLTAARKQFGRVRLVEEFLTNARESLRDLDQAPPPPAPLPDGVTVSGRVPGPRPRFRDPASNLPEMAQAHRAWEQGHYAEALAALDALLARQPGHHHARLNRIDLLRALGRDAEALAEVDRHLADGADDADAWHLRGLLLGGFLEEAPAEEAPAVVDAERLDQAVAAFDQAILLEPNVFPHRLYKARTLARRSHQAQARLNLVAGLTQERDEAARQALLRPASLAYRLALARARETFDAAARLAPDPAPVWLEKGAFLLDLDETQEAEAVAALKEAVTRRPTLAEGWERLAQVHHRHGDRAQALACLRQAVAADPARRDQRLAAAAWLTAAERAAL